MITFVDSDGKVKEEVFDLVVLSVDLRHRKAPFELAQRLASSWTDMASAKRKNFHRSNRAVQGLCLWSLPGPKDIPETVTQASAATAAASALLTDVRGTLTKKKEYPPEIDVAGQEPRIGIFVSTAGSTSEGWSRCRKWSNTPGASRVWPSSKKSLHLFAGYPGEDEEGNP